MEQYNTHEIRNELSQRGLFRCSLKRCKSWHNKCIIHELRHGESMTDLVLEQQQQRMF